MRTRSMSQREKEKLPSPHLHSDRNTVSVSTRNKMRRRTQRERDKLSNLPDEIRFKIASFLNLKEAIRITVLSKKWRRIISSLPCLDFRRYEGMPFKFEEYRDIINCILLCHDDSPVDKFSLITAVDGNHITRDRVDKWISFAVTHKVQDLHLSFRIYPCSNFSRDLQNQAKSLATRQELPRSLLNCTTLSILSLGSINLYHPVTFSFPLLKSLTLTKVEILAKKSIQELSLSCDNNLLEKLVINRVICRSPLTISGANVKCLTLTGVQGKDRTIKLSMPSLLEFHFKGQKAVNISLDTTMSVWKADFYFQPPLSTPKIGFRTVWANNLTMGLCNVEMLTLSTFDIKLLTGDQLLEGSIPIPYCSVKHLTFKSNLDDNQVNLLSFIVRRFPNLHTLIIHKEEAHSSKKVKKKEGRLLGEVPGGDALKHLSNKVENEDGWLLGEGPGGDALKHVKKIGIYSFGGSEAEVNLVRYLFDKASVLERMDIHYSPCSDDKYKMISTQLMSFGKSSPNISIIKQYN
ncbi:hypothetical protein ACHQM5_004710 [Ranunculus cassubicifolius]